LLPTGLFSDPCHWDLAGDGSWPQDGDVPTNGTVDELVTALSSNVHYETGPATDTVLAGYPAKQMVVQLPAEDFGACDKQTGDASGSFRVFGGGDDALSAQGSGNRWQLSIIDVAGARMIVVIGDYAATSTADHIAAQGIVDSLVITP
jgi:hypothetical protein